MTWTRCGRNREGGAGEGGGEGGEGGEGLGMCAVPMLVSCAEFGFVVRTPLEHQSFPRQFSVQASTLQTTGCGNTGGGDYEDHILPHIPTYLRHIFCWSLSLKSHRNDG